MGLKALPQAPPEKQKIDGGYAPRPIPLRHPWGCQIEYTVQSPPCLVNGDSGNAKGCRICIHVDLRGRIGDLSTIRRTCWWRRQLPFGVRVIRALVVVQPTAVFEHHRKRPGHAHPPAAFARGDPVARQATLQRLEIVHGRPQGPANVDEIHHCAADLPRVQLSQDVVSELGERHVCYAHVGKTAGATRRTHARRCWRWYRIKYIAMSTDGDA